MPTSVKAKNHFGFVILALLLMIMFGQSAKAENATVESGIREALEQKSSYSFMLSSEYLSTSNLVGYSIFLDTSVTPYQETDSPNQADVIEHYMNKYSAGLIVRIDDGIAHMANSTDFTCELSVLDDGQGVSLFIQSINDELLTASISGTIQGNTLSAHEEYQELTFFGTTHGGTGMYAAGDYEVNVEAIAASDLGPQPVTLSCSFDTAQHTITLSWVDPTPTGPAAYYEIYRSLNLSMDCTLLTTVSDCTTWVETSKEVTDDFQTSVCYYIVSYNENGIPSEPSNELVLDIDLWENPSDVS